jgi:hypothetical protein
MRKSLLALLLLSTSALAEKPQDVMDLMSRMRVLYIRGEHILMTVTGIKLDAKTGSFSATAQWQPPEDKGIPYTCELPVDGQLTGYVLQFANNRCSGRFTFEDGEFVGEAQIAGVGVFPAKFSVR